MPDYALLGLLARRPASGYDLARWIREEGRWYGRSSSMTPIYRALKNLAELGWATARIDARDAAPDAKVYGLTPRGRGALVEWAKQPHEPNPRPMSPDFVVRMEFAGQLGPEYALDIVDRELEFRREQRRQELEGAVWGSDWGDDGIPEIDTDWLAHLDRMVHDRGWQSTSLFIGWLETTQRSLASIVERRRAGEGARGGPVVDP